MRIEFTPDRFERFQALVSKYEVPRSALLPVLYLAQEQWGYLSKDALRYVASLLEIPEREVFEAASFYTLFRKKDMGCFCLQVCNNITCTLLGSEKLMRVLKEELGVEENKVTEDGLFSVVPVQCLGSCDTAPVVQINEEYFENMSEDRLRAVVRGLKNTQSLEELQERVT